MSTVIQGNHHENKIETINPNSAFHHTLNNPFIQRLVPSSDHERYLQSHIQLVATTISEKLNDSSSVVLCPSAKSKEELKGTPFDFLKKFKHFDSSTGTTVVTPKKAISEHLQLFMASADETFDILPCRARGMPLSHNRHSAIFKINRQSIDHGTDLICSHPTCRDEGTKFRYCKICKVPASKRTFSYFHAHRNHQGNTGTNHGSETNDIKNNSLTTASVGRVTPQHIYSETDLLSISQSVASYNTRNDGPSATVHPQDVSLQRNDESNTTHTKDTQCKRRHDQHIAWEKLLSQRPKNNAPQSIMTAWVMKVLNVSDNWDD